VRVASLSPLRAFIALGAVLLVGSSAPAAMAAIPEAAATSTQSAIPPFSEPRTATGSIRAPHLPPYRFAEIADGVVLIRTFSCRGSLIATGTGFLVGEAVVMTARHVIQGACRVQVRASGQWIRVTRSTWWRTNAQSNGRVEDLATLRLAHPADGHIFEFRRNPPAAGANLAMLGHPLGSARVNMTQGRLMRRQWIGRVPVILVNLLGAEGASGSPLVDNNGQVVGILQLGLGGSDALGQRTAGVVVGIDLSVWWGKGQATRDLCRAYPRGGIPGCGPPPVEPPPPPAAPGYYSCWVQHTAGQESSIDWTKRIFALPGSQLLADGPNNYWLLVENSVVPQVSASASFVVITPNGTSWERQSFTWDADTARVYLPLDIQFDDGSYFWQRPSVWGEGLCRFRWEFEDGRSCTVQLAIVG
jgi:hypothetical protein